LCYDVLGKINDLEREYLVTDLTEAGRILFPLSWKGGLGWAGCSMQREGWGPTGSQKSHCPGSTLAPAPPVTSRVTEQAAPALCLSFLIHLQGDSRVAHGKSQSSVPLQAAFHACLCFQLLACTLESQQQRESQGRGRRSWSWGGSWEPVGCRTCWMSGLQRSAMCVSHWSRTLDVAGRSSESGTVYLDSVALCKEQSSMA
jgi:hypothetical protein